MTSSRPTTSSRPSRDRVLAGLTAGSAAVAAAVVLLILGFLLAESADALATAGVAAFFTDARWAPREGQFNLLPMLVATLLVSAGAMALAVPLGLGSAIFCRFYAPRPLAAAHRRLVELLAGVPSVVYGFWGLVVLVPLIASVRPPGPSLLAAVAVLSLMILPTIALTADAALGAVPSETLAGAAALALGRWSTVRRVALPAAAPHLGTGVLLALARAIGETMAVLMVCGNVAELPASPFDPVRPLTANIALEMAFAMGQHRSSLFVSGLLLLLLVTAVVFLADRLGRRTHE